ncbi:hypothetical protein, partial [uncultured Oscillibacter sp.]|uniref:hypothetical protein n=1 Tax=uncultured Oscillibacter sp. TaxID=876091 RepID=UPI00260F555C
SQSGNNSSNNQNNTENNQNNNSNNTNSSNNNSDPDMAEIEQATQSFLSFQISENIFNAIKSNLHVLRVKQDYKW